MSRKHMENSLEEKRPDLAKEWHPKKNGSLTPENVTIFSHEKVWWRCSEEHEWKESIKNRVRGEGRGCPYCFKRKMSFFERHLKKVLGICYAIFCIYIDVSFLNMQQGRLYKHGALLLTTHEELIIILFEIVLYLFHPSIGILRGNKWGRFKVWIKSVFISKEPKYFFWRFLGGIYLILFLTTILSTGNYAYANKQGITESITYGLRHKYRWQDVNYIQFIPYYHLSKYADSRYLLSVVFHLKNKRSISLTTYSNDAFDMQQVKEILNIAEQHKVKIEIPVVSSTKQLQLAQHYGSFFGSALPVVIQN